MNGRIILLRGEANCCVFPETGHMPMTVAEWRKILSPYQSYGVNCIRFHSHCPPDAAFTAADEIGMMMQPELSHWNSKTAFEEENSWNYYQLELRQILLTYVNRLSFVMLTFGNELCAGALGHKRMGLLLKEAGELSLLAYREEIEAVMRTKEMSGISLLALQDFPGQGTALVGMLNSHMQPKPFDFANPKRFRQFFTDVLPLVLLDKYTYRNTETIAAEIRIANYGKRDISGTCRIRWTDGGKIVKESD